MCVGGWSGETSLEGCEGTSHGHIWRQRRERGRGASLGVTGPEKFIRQNKAASSFNSTYPERRRPLSHLRSGQWWEDDHVVSLNGGRWLAPHGPGADD